MHWGNNRDVDARAARSVVGRKELLEVADHPIDFIIPQFGEHRQGDILSGVAFCFGNESWRKPRLSQASWW
jgi:hypothetical protein